MSKKSPIRFVVLTLLAIGVALPITNPSEEQHKKVFYASLKKSDAPLSPVHHTMGKIGDGIESIFGKNPFFVYENKLFYSSLKMNDTTVTVGILGHVFVSPAAK